MGRHYTGFRCIVLIVFCMGSNAPAQPPDLAEGGPPVERPAAGVPQASELDANSPLGSDALAEWLVVLFSEAQSIAAFAQERAENEEVRNFARQSALERADFVRELQQAIIRRQRDETTAVGAPSAVASELQDVAERLRSEVDARVEVREERRTADPTAVPPLRETRRESGLRRSPDTATEDRQPVQLRRDRRPEREGAAEAADRRILRREGLLQRLREAADERDRGAARERIREVLPALRDQLPELLNLVAVAIEEGNSADYAAWLPLEREFEQRLSQNMREELAQYDRQGFDQAYLGYEILANRKLATALELVQERTDGDLRPALDSGSELVRTHLEQVRQLKQGADNAAGRQSQP